MLPFAHHRLSLPHRFTAMFAVAMVLLLSGLAVRPDWHEKLCQHHDSVSNCAHQHGHQDTREESSFEETCVISQFARGHVLAVLIFLLLLWLGGVHAQRLLIDESLALRSSHFHLPPGCGPPLV